MIYATNSFLYRKFLSCSHPVEYQLPNGYFDWRAFIHSEEPIPDDVIDSVYQAAGDPEPFAYEDQLCAQVRADYAKLGQYPRDWAAWLLDDGIHGISRNVDEETGFANGSSAGIHESLHGNAVRGLD